MMGRGSRHHAAIPSRTWARVRRAILIRDKYRCRLCGAAGRLEIDHVIPLDHGGAALDPANLQTLCVPCHLAKTAAERGRTVDPERAAWREYLRAGIATEPIDR